MGGSGCCYSGDAEGEYEFEYAVSVCRDRREVRRGGEKLKMGSVGVGIGGGMVWQRAGLWKEE